MKAYIVKEGFNPYTYSPTKINMGRIIVEHENSIILIATPTIRQEFFNSYTLKTAISKNLVEPIDLVNYKHVHPHLYKPVKTLIQTPK